MVGGAAVTEEFHPGFRNSVAAYTVSLLQAKVIRDLRLAEHGLRIVERPLSNFLPLEDGYLKVGGGLEATQREFAKFSARDAKNLPHYWARLERVADVLRDAGSGNAAERRWRGSGSPGTFSFRVENQKASNRSTT